MYTAATVLIVIVSILLVLVVLVQNSKGGGLAAGFSSSNQVMGVKKTSDFIEKLTWGLAASLVILCLFASFSLPNKEARTTTGSSMQEQIDNAGTAPQKAPAQNQPVQSQPAQPVQNPQQK